MREIHCIIKAHVDGAAQGHSRWFSWGQMPEGMQKKAVHRLGMLALFVAGASATAHQWWDANLPRRVEAGTPADTADTVGTADPSEAEPSVAPTIPMESMEP